MQRREEGRSVPTQRMRATPASRGPQEHLLQVRRELLRVQVRMGIGQQHGVSFRPSFLISPRRLRIATRRTGHYNGGRERYATGLGHMAELRQDPICGRWVIIATERGARPSELSLGRGEPKGGFCPFCEGNEDRTPPEIAAVRPGGGPSNSPGWRVRVVPNKFPALSLNGHLTARVHTSGHRRTAPGVGTHEVIIESPHHAISPTQMPVEDFEHVIATYCGRAEALKADPRLAYVLIFKNVGQEAGASIEHCHSQVMGVPVMPRRVAEEMERCEHFHRDHARCLFCDLLAEELADGSRLVAQTQHFAADQPLRGRLPVHDLGAAAVPRGPALRHDGGADG